MAECLDSKLRCIWKVMVRSQDHYTRRDFRWTFLLHCGKVDTAGTTSFSLQICMLQSNLGRAWVAELEKWVVDGSRFEYTVSSLCRNGKFESAQTKYPTHIFGDAGCSFVALINEISFSSLTKGSWKGRVWELNLYVNCWFIFPIDVESSPFHPWQLSGYSNSIWSGKKSTFASSTCVLWNFLCSEISSILATKRKVLRFGPFFFQSHPSKKTAKYQIYATDQPRSCSVKSRGSRRIPSVPPSRTLEVLDCCWTYVCDAFE